MCDESTTFGELPSGRQKKNGSSSPVYMALFDIDCSVPFLAKGGFKLELPKKVQQVLVGYQSDRVLPSAIKRAFVSEIVKIKGQTLGKYTSFVSNKVADMIKDGVIRYKKSKKLCR